MGWFDNIFGGGQAQGYRDQMNYLNQIPQQWNSLDPFIQAGQNQLPGFTNLLSQLQNGSYVNNAMKNFYQSPLYQNQMNAALAGANQAAAAGGQLGTPASQQAAEQAAGAIASQNQNAYLQNVMQGAGMGLSGGENIIGLGSQDALQKANAMSDLLQAQGDTAYNEDRANATGMDNALAFGLNGLATAFGGPMGGAMASGATGQMGGGQGGSSGFLGSLGRGLQDFGFGNRMYQMPQYSGQQNYGYNPYYYYGGYNPMMGNQGYQPGAWNDPNLYNNVWS